MLITKAISFRRIIQWIWMHIIWLLLWMSLVAVCYYFEILDTGIPWLPISVIGTAVAFYTGFKNNQAYDRMWEARKIWGGIVNDSRSWGMMIDGYITNQFRKEDISEEEIYALKKKMIYRHIAWLYAHRSQLLVPTPWEHASQRGVSGKYALKLQKRFGIGLIDDDITRSELSLFLPPEEHDRLIAHVNTATQIINEQGRHLKEIRKADLIDDFRHVELMDLLKSFYTLQGKNERIKKFPFPRQYANISRYFVGIFIFLLPFSMIPELMNLGHWGIPIAVIISALIGWVYLMMELIGDYTENPFKGMASDIPMLSLVRVIEIDLREMLGETDLPPSVESKNGILM